MKRAFVTGVGTSDLLGTEASEDCNTSSAETPNLPRVWLNEAATLGQQRMQRRRDLGLPGVGLRNERTILMTAVKDCVAVEVAALANRAR